MLTSKKRKVTADLLNQHEVLVSNSSLSGSEVPQRSTYKLYILRYIHLIPVLVHDDDGGEHIEIKRKEKCALIELNEQQLNSAKRTTCSLSLWREISRSNQSLTSIPFLGSRTFSIDEKEVIVQESVLVLTVNAYGE